MLFIQEQHRPQWPANYIIPKLIDRPTIVRFDNDNLDIFIP